MTVADTLPLAFEHTYAEALGEMTVAWPAEPAPDPRLVVGNEPLAVELGTDPAALRRAGGLAVLLGQAPGLAPVAEAYAGHQYGRYAPKLGDGRALLIGELIDSAGRRRDVHLKGSGRTPFSRRGDGKAVLGPMLREHLIGEAMHALGIPTTRALAVVATGETVLRESPLPGAILVRVAASHLRVGTFQYAAARGDENLLRRLADYAIGRHYPEAANAANPYLALFEHVVEAQAALIARWMLVGFVHGVMNTDNVTVSGETIDYGPCAFMDTFDPATVFSSIDHTGRYAYGNQPTIGQWNVARFGETLLPLIDPDEDRSIDAATEVLTSFTDRYRHHWTAGMHAKLGLPGHAAIDPALFDQLTALLHRHRVDYTSFFRALAHAAAGNRATVRGLFTDPAEFDAWAARWRAEATRLGVEPGRMAEAMNRVNPVYIPRNHLVEAALASAVDGDLTAYELLLDHVTAPFEARPAGAPFAGPGPASFGSYRTFCGT